MMPHTRHGAKMNKNDKIPNFLQLLTVVFAVEFLLCIISQVIATNV